MEITFLGTGEACDPGHRNTSILVDSGKDRHLLDCGFSSAQAFLGIPDNTRLNSLWLSHLHGDHYFGVPQLILHFYTQKRREPLMVLSGANAKDSLLNAIDLAYPRLPGKLPFPIYFKKIDTGTPVEYNGLTWQCTKVHHPQSAYGLRLSKAGCSLYYSGDGRPTPESLKLMRKCSLVIHEAHTLQPGNPNHFSIEECLTLAGDLDIPKLALVHLDKDTRNILAKQKVSLKAHEACKLFIPVDGKTITLPAPDDCQ